MIFLAVRGCSVFRWVVDILSQSSEVHRNVWLGRFDHFYFMQLALKPLYEYFCFQLFFMFIHNLQGFDEFFAATPSASSFSLNSPFASYNNRN